MEHFEMKADKTALVVGANGVIGRNLIDYLLTLPNGISLAFQDVAARTQIGYDM